MTTPGCGARWRGLPTDHDADHNRRAWPINGGTRSPGCHAYPSPASTFAIAITLPDHSSRRPAHSARRYILARVPAFGILPTRSQLLIDCPSPRRLPILPFFRTRQLPEPQFIPITPASRRRPSPPVQRSVPATPGFPDRASRPIPDQSEIKQQHCQVGRGDAADAARLPEARRAGPASASPAPRAGAGAPRRSRSAAGIALALHPLEPLDLRRLPVDVARVLRLQDHLLDHVGPGVPRSQRRVPAAQVAPTRPRSAAATSSSVSPSLPVRLQVLLQAPRSPAPSAEAAPTPSSSTEPDPPAERRQPAVGVVVPQQQPVLGPRREHAVRLIDALRHQVVDQHADVRLAAVEDERRLALQLEGRVDARPSAPGRRPPRSRSCR